MDKDRRRRLILDLVRGRTIRTQEEFLQALGREGVAVSQGTISRDIKDLGLVKIPGKDGLARYAPPDRRAARSERSARTIRKWAVAFVRSGSVIVAETVPAQAVAVADAILDLELHDVLGVFPYGARVLVVGTSDEGAERASAHLRGFLA